jgi:hypothetical protein
MATYYVEPPRELLEHEAHLPEVIECRCGYRRPEIEDES